VRPPRPSISQQVGVAAVLAEFLGGAIALNLLFGVPLLPAAGVTAVVPAGLLALAPHGRHRRPQRPPALAGRHRLAGPAGLTAAQLDRSRS
jgi:hypothetical protein